MLLVHGHRLSLVSSKYEMCNYQLVETQTQADYQVTTNYQILSISLKYVKSPLPCKSSVIESLPSIQLLTDLYNLFLKSKMLCKYVYFIQKRVAKMWNFHQNLCSLCNKLQIFVILALILNCVFYFCIKIYAHRLTVILKFSM